jgi:hypothetical protein
LAAFPASGQNIFNVRSYGATGDGKAADTIAISKAIAAAHAVGGGVVVFPPGQYRSGTFELLSNVTLDLEPGSVVKGSRNVADYGAIGEYGFGKIYGDNSSGEGDRVGLIIARNAQNISIIGRGSIDGEGDSFFDLTKPHSTPDFDARYTRQGQDFGNPKYGTEHGPAQLKPEGRPGTMIIFSHCKNVLLRDVTLSNAPNWTLHFQHSEDIVVSGVHILNDPLLPNNDGVDCMRCRNAHFSDCDIRTGDDDFAIVGSDNVEVTNCSLASYSAAIRLEDTRWSTFDNLSIHANRGLAVFGRGQEHTAHILFSNVVIETKLITGHWWGKGEPIYIAARASGGPSEIRDIRFTNIRGEAESGIMVYGSADSVVRNIAFDHIGLEMRAAESRIAQSVGGNFDLRWTATNLSEAIFKHNIPALYARYVDGITIRDFDLNWNDNLPGYFSSAIECEDFSNLEITEFKGREAPVSTGAAAIELRRGNGVTIRESRAGKGTGSFLSLSDVSGERLFAENDLSDAQRAFEPAEQKFTLFGNKMPSSSNHK